MLQSCHSSWQTYLPIHCPSNFPFLLHYFLSTIEKFAVCEGGLIDPLHNLKKLSSRHRIPLMTQLRCFKSISIYQTLWVINMDINITWSLDPLFLLYINLWHFCGERSLKWSYLVILCKARVALKTASPTVMIENMKKERFLIDYLFQVCKCQYLSYENSLGLKSIS